MKQLSGTDNLFLTMEKGNQMAHVATLGIYDPSTAPTGQVRFKAILDFFSSRLNHAQLFRRRLVRTPLDLDRPYWVDDPTIDIEYHVRHIALPKPGDWRQLCIQVARLHARPIDFSRPPWEAYVIEGLDNIPGLRSGCFAVYNKMHHSLVDGGAGVEVIKLLHSLTPEPDDAYGEDRHWVTIADREPTALELLTRTVGTRFTRVLGAAKLSVELGSTALRIGQEQFGKLVKPVDGETADLMSQLSRAPTTRFSGKVSPHRVVDALPLSLDQMKTIREAFPGTTVNDIFMSVCGGALRRYLSSKDELPIATLSAMIPMSTRSGKGEADEGNKIGTVAMKLFTDIEDDGERLRATMLETERAKQSAEALGRDLQAKLFDVIPTAVADFLVNKIVTPTANLTVSNVRGPNVPLYTAGAKLVTFMPVSMVMDGMGLNITGFSYNGALWVCTIACRNMMPDPAFFTQCIRDSFDAHLAAGAPVKPKGGPKKR